MFKPGNIVRLQIDNFRALNKLSVVLKPGVNYFLAPNGHGKSSILMAIVLALGSDWKYLIQLHKENQLISTGQTSGSIELLIANADISYDRALKSPTNGLKRIKVELEPGKITYFIGKNIASRADVQKLAIGLQDFVDNPFTSMMQLEAQKIMNETAERKLKYVLQLTRDDVEQTFKVLEHIREEERNAQFFQQLAEHKNVFHQLSSQFRAAHNSYSLSKAVEVYKEQKIKIGNFLILVLVMEHRDIVMRHVKLIEDNAKKLAEYQSQLTRKSKKKVEIDTQISKMEEQKRLQFKQMRENTQNLDIAKNKLKDQKNSHNIIIQTLATMRDNMQAQSSQNHIQMVNKRNQVEQQYNQLKIDVDALQAQAQQLEQTGVAEISYQALQVIENKIRTLDQEIQKISNDQDQTFQRHPMHQDWSRYLSQNHKSIQSRSDTNFTLYPLIFHIGVRTGTFIPESTAKKIMTFMLGADLYSVYTASKQVFDELSLQFSEYRGERQRPSAVKQMNQWVGKSYQDAITTSQTNVENSVKQFKVNERQLQTNARVKDNFVNCTEFLAGNYILLNEILNNFGSSYYFDNTIGSKVFSDKETSTEIEYVLSHNQSVYQIFTKRGDDVVLYRKLMHNNSIVGKEIITLDTPYFNLIQIINTAKRDIPMIFDEIKELRQKKKNEEVRLEDDKRASAEREKKITALRKQREIARTNMIRAEEELQEIERYFNSVVVVDPNQYKRQQSEAKTAQIAAVRTLMEIYQINDLIASGLIKDSGLIASITELSILQQQLNTEVAELQQQVQELGAQQDAVISQKDRYKTALDEHEIRLQTVFKTNDVNELMDSHLTQDKIRSYVDNKVQVVPFTELLTSYSITKEQLSSIDVARAEAALQDKIKQVSGKQIYDIEDVKQRLAAEIGAILRLYATIHRTGEHLLEAVKRSEENLEAFVRSLSKEFERNLASFSVKGALSMVLWTDKRRAAETIRELQQYLADFSTAKPFGPYQEQFVDVLKNVSLEATNERQAAAHVPADHDEFKRELDGFVADVGALQKVDFLLGAFRPGLEISTQFAKNEALRSPSLSGGERSVVSICLAACFKQAGLVMIDEINQGMDENFEVAAHQLIMGLQGQVLVSSPKLSEHMMFEGAVAVHVLMKAE